MRVEIIESEKGFAALRPEWDELLAQSDAANVFLTWEWLYTWWRHLGGARRLHLLAARRRGELVAIAPLAAQPGRFGLVPPRLELLGTGIVGSDYLDVIVRRGDEGAVHEAFADHLFQTGVALDLRQLLHTGTRAEALAQTLAVQGWRLSRRDGDICPFLKLAGHTWDSFLATLGPEHRANVRRRLRKLEQRGAALEQVQTEERRCAVLSVLFRLHERRWRSRGGSDAFASPSVLSFHDEVTRLALERGWLRLNALWLDGEPVAALYGLRYGGTFSFYQAGFEPAFAPSSVGLVLLALSILKAIDEGAAEFDLLHGDEAYKLLWAREARRLSRIEADPPGVGAMAYRTAVEAARAARRTLRRLLPPAVAARLSALRRQRLLGSFHAASTR